MQLEKIANGFVYAIAIYLVVLLYGMNFILSNLSFGMLTSDFWLMALIILLPLFLCILYFSRRRAELLYNHQTFLRRTIFAFIIISVVFTIIFILPFNY